MVTSELIRLPVIWNIEGLKADYRTLGLEIYTFYIHYVQSFKI